ncbi:acetylajmalan esterase-like [Chenopodium quinoa]|uniref:acetylajmalan esterase-like n=1 Tax=Chenopodium quinoa TaxID=63459 RepID=UPI000B786661|nr:acetylajmalan esterase-like [Chenopodium quinoa]
MASMKLMFFVVLALCSSFPLPLYALPQEIPKVDAIYQFGDSISDTGNLIRESPIGEHTPFARLPYGQTFFHKPTGRCSNGLLMIDFFARYFKLPFLDAYLNKDGNFAHGVNFAVAGSTALDTSTLAAKNITSPVTNSSLSVQMGWFKSHLHSLCPNPKDCKAKLANALFIIETGGNDFNYTFFGRKTMEEVQQMVDEVLQAITNAVKEVIGLGATKVVVPGNFAIGCMPIYLSNFKTNDSNMYDDLHCLKGLNGFAMFQNDRLKVAIKELQTQHPNVAIVYADYFNALKGLLQNATSNGLEKDEVQKTCCGIGDNEYNFNITRMCGNNGVPVCRDPSKLISWDGVHMTQHAYRVMAKGLIKQIVQGIAN